MKIILLICLVLLNSCCFEKSKKQKYRVVKKQGFIVSYEDTTFRYKLQRISDSVNITRNFYEGRFEVGDLVEY